MEWKVAIEGLGDVDGFCAMVLYELYTGGGTCSSKLSPAKSDFVNTSHDYLTIWQKQLHWFTNPRKRKEN